MPAHFAVVTSKSSASRHAQEATSAALMPLSFLYALDGAHSDSASALARRLFIGRAVSNIGTAGLFVSGDGHGLTPGLMSEYIACR